MQSVFVIGCWRGSIYAVLLIAYILQISKKGSRYYFYFISIFFFIIYVSVINLLWFNVILTLVSSTGIRSCTEAGSKALLACRLLAWLQTAAAEKIKDS